MQDNAFGRYIKDVADQNGIMAEDVDIPQVR